MNSLFVVGIRKHRVLGNVFVGYVVNERKLYFEITHTVYLENVEKLPLKLSPKEMQLVKFINEFSDNTVIKLFSRAKLNAREFFGTVNLEYVEKHIRPYVEKRLVKCIDLLIDSPTRLFFKNEVDEIHQNDEIFLNVDPAEAVFNFNKTPNGSQYFLSVKQGEEETTLLNKKHMILTNNPCRMIVENQLHYFNDIDGKKLLPFFSKEYINIYKSAEKKYFETFVLNSIRNFSVKNKGFSIIETNPVREALLSLEKDWKGDAVLLLNFSYDGKKYLTNHTSQVSVKMTTKDDDYTFYKTNRDKTWENECIDKLRTIGLIMETGGNFKLEKKEKRENIEQHDLVTWIADKENFLTTYGFKVSQKFFKKKFITQKAKLNFRGNKKKDWFDIYAIVEFGEFKIPFIKLKNHILNGYREYRLPNGEYAVLPKEWFSEFKDMFLFCKEAMEWFSIDKMHFTLLENKEIEGIDKSFLQAFKSLTSENKIQCHKASPKLNANLRSYQQTGFDWMYQLQENNFGGCLADDMGLGKTIQTLALLQKSIEDGKNLSYDSIQPETNQSSEQLNLFDISPKTTKTDRHKIPSLLIMPVSLTHNWANEIVKFTPNLKFLIYQGAGREREIDRFREVDLVITSYGVTRIDIEILKQQQFFYIILDESQYIKNPQSKTYLAVTSLPSTHKLVLTGTPIENSLSDLWAQMNFINEGLLGNLRFFKDEFQKPIENSNDEERQKKLKMLIQPFILRRTKGQVATELPDLTEQILFCDMETEQAKIYETEKSKIRNALLNIMVEESHENTNLLVLQGLTKLRQLANHPKMINPESQVMSGKFEEIKRNLENMKAEGHKVLIFSSFVKHLNLFAEYFDQNYWDYSMLTGATRNREEVVTKFQDENKTQFFLISIKAGGVGLNLTSADYVFILDPWWNPAVENQAISRAHRIGQTQKVFVYRFITRGSVEEKIIHLQKKKSNLADAFVNSNNPFKTLGKNDLVELFT